MFWINNLVRYIMHHMVSVLKYLATALVALSGVLLTLGFFCAFQWNQSQFFPSLIISAMALFLIGLTLFIICIIMAKRQEDIENAPPF